MLIKRIKISWLTCEKAAKDLVTVGEFGKFCGKDAWKLLIISEVKMRGLIAKASVSFSVSYLFLLYVLILLFADKWYSSRLCNFVNLWIL